MYKINKLNKSRFSQGFTLIEIMVVLVIIGIMGLLIVPNILGRPDEARITVAKADIRAISNAIELYKLDNYIYPSTQQGLAALTTKPSGSPIPKNWISGGYLRKVPADPWKNSYLYISPGAKTEFDLYSYGADGKEGGEGVNADIGNWDL